jgi:hypothetical protein
VPNPSHEVEHHIHTGGQAHCLDPEKLEIAKAEFKLLESTGTVRHSTLPWVSLLHMVPKKDGS